MFWPFPPLIKLLNCFSLNIACEGLTAAVQDTDPVTAPPCAVEASLLLVLSVLCYITAHPVECDGDLPPLSLLSR